MRPGPSDLPHGPRGGVFRPQRVGFAVDKGVRDGEGHDAVIGEAALVREQFKVRGLDVVPLKAGTDDVSCYRSQHASLPACMPVPAA